MYAQKLPVIPFWWLLIDKIYIIKIVNLKKIRSFWINRKILNYENDFYQETLNLGRNNYCPWTYGTPGLCLSSGDISRLLYSRDFPSLEIERRHPRILPCPGVIQAWRPFPRRKPIWSSISFIVSPKICYWLCNRIQFYCMEHFSNCIHAHVLWRL